MRGNSKGREHGRRGRMTEKQRNMSYALGMFFNVLRKLNLITVKTHARVIRITDAPAIRLSEYIWLKNMAKQRPKHRKYKHVKRILDTYEHSSS